MSPHFLRIEFAGRGRWTTLAPIRMDRTTVPAGFACNLGSIPRLLWWLFGHPLTGWFAAEAVAHDYDCQERAMPSGMVHRLFYDRLRASARLEPVRWRRALRLVVAALMYAAVAVFGPRWTVA